MSSISFSKLLCSDVFGLTLVRVLVSINRHFLTFIIVYLFIKPTKNTAITSLVNEQETQEPQVNEMQESLCKQADVATAV